MAGNTTLGENYAFGGMYHIFDQHAEAGKNELLKAICFYQNVCLEIGSDDHVKW